MSPANSDEQPAQTDPQAAAPPPHPLIELDAFRRLRTDQWRVLDCRFELGEPDAGREAYQQAHIPGALYVDLERDLSAPATGKNGRHPLAPVPQLEQLFSRLGIEGSTPVVAYDASGGPYAARLWWTLRYLGHEHVQVLNGGFPAWQQAGLDTESGSEQVDASEFRADTQPERLISLEQMETMLEGKDRAVLLDARAPERYRGESEPYDPVAGRIPGARNHYWKDNLGARGRFLPPAQLRQRLQAALGEGPKDELICYCGSGVTAAHNALALAAAGLPEAQVYIGSWSEWCADPERPIERDV